MGIYPLKTKSPAIYQLPGVKEESGSDSVAALCVIYLILFGNRCQKVMGSVTG